MRLCYTSLAQTQRFFVCEDITSWVLLAQQRLLTKLNAQFSVIVCDV